jgi:PAS domain S-box-containing protein
MNSPLRVLHLEDDIRDAELVRATLESEGLPTDLTRVEAEQEFVSALKDGSFDLILADYTLPSFDGLSALRLAQEHAPDVPFLFVSGTLGEDVAIEALKRGATDYVLKTRLARLGPSLTRALREAREKAERKRAEQALRDSEEQWKAAFESNPVMYFMADRTGTTLSVNAFGADQLGYKQSELIGQSVLNAFYEPDREQVRKHVENCFQNLGRTFKWEARKVRRDGTVIWVRETANALLLKNQPVLLVVCEDITDRKRAEESARRSEKQLRDVFETIPAMAWSALPDGRVDFMNRAWQDYTGLSMDKALGRKSADIIHPDDQAATIAEWESALKNGQPLETEVRLRRADGEYRSWFVRNVPLRDEHGNIVKWYGTAIDIEDRKRAEEAVHRSEKQLRDLIETIPAMAFVTRPDGSNEFVSRKWIEFSGLSAEQSAGSGWEKTLHPDDVAQHLGKWREALASGQPAESEARHRDAHGTYRWLLVRAVPLHDERGNILNWYGTAIDIEDRKRAEALLAGEKRILEMIATGVPLKEIMGGLCLIIEEYRPGTHASVLLVRPDGLHLDSVAGPSLPKGWMQQMEKLPIGPCAGSCGTAAYRGSAVIVSDIATDPLWEVPEHRGSALRYGLRASWSNPILSSEGKVLGTFCMYYREPRSPDAHDLGLIEMATDLARVAIERERAEEAVRRSEKKYRDLINTSPDAIFVVDQDARWALANPAAAELTGYSIEELIGRSVSETYLANERRLLQTRLEKLKTEGLLRYDRQFVRRNGDLVPVEVSISALPGGYSQAVVRDISERKKSEEALRASEQVARGQAEALTFSLDVLATAPEPKKFISKMLMTICRQLNAHSGILGLLDEANEAPVFPASAEGDEITQIDPEHPFMKDPSRWKRSRVLQELVFTRSPVICEDIETDPRVDSTAREYYKPKGLRKFLAVPLLAGGQVKGFITVRHRERAAYRPEEIELTQALAHQVMLALQLTELAEQSRRTAILAERNRMARDIHDTLAQGFTGVIVQLEAVADAISRSEPRKVSKCLQRASDLARRSLNEARRSVHALRPEALERVNFWEALKGIIKNTAAATPIRTKLKLRGKLPLLPLAWQEDLMRIGQEALTNTLKYAHADTFETRLVCHANKLRLEFQDDGDGFNVKAHHDGVGLTGMRERVAQMGGELKITSAHGKGTKIIVVLPCNGESMS